MASFSLKSFRRGASIALGVLAAMLVIGAWIGLQGRTLAPWWQPLTAGAAAALLSWALLRGLYARRFPSAPGWARLAAHMAGATALFTVAVLGANYLGADHSRADHTDAVVQARLRYKHNRSRRVGRRYVASGETYHTYHLLLRFPSGAEKEVSVPLKRYNRARRGDLVPVEVAPGLLGMPVFAQEKRGLPREG